MDDVFRRALFGIAAELQLLAFEADAESLYEADLRSASRRALQMHIAQKVVIEAHVTPLTWKPGTGRFDIGIRKRSGTGFDALAELKLWKGKGKSVEAAWDAWKLASAYKQPVAWHVYLIAAGPAEHWEEGLPGTEFMAAGSWSAAESWRRYEKAFQQWSTANAGPLELPAGLKTELIGTLPIQIVASEPWRLTCTRVKTTPGPGWKVPA
jgi:hypothetical protein